MKILFINTHTLWTPHFETELELAQLHIDKKDEVHFLHCTGQLSPCDLIIHQNISKKLLPETKDSDMCHLCITKVHTGVSLLSKKIKVHPIIYPGIDSREHICEKHHFIDADGIRNYYYHNYELGESILSSLISHTRNPFPEISKFESVINEYIRTGKMLYDSVLLYLKELQPDRVYIFNGRFTHTRAAVRACESINQNFYVHEVGFDVNHYSLSHNATPHSQQLVKDKMLTEWQNEPDSEKKYQLAERFFNNRYNGNMQSVESFTHRQIKGRLPDNWDETKTNVAIFNSSEDEFQAIGSEWRNTIYLNQLDGIKKIVNDPLVTANKYLHFYLRIHPNLTNVVNEYSQSILNMNYPNLTIITPESEISTYDLLFKSNRIISFGSTMGLEATYWGVPSILAGQSYYKFLDVTHNPQSHQEMVQLLLDPFLPPKNKLNTMIAGYFYSVHGYPFKYYQPTGFLSGLFKGVDLKHETGKLNKTVTCKLGGFLQKIKSKVNDF